MKKTTLVLILIFQILYSLHGQDISVTFANREAEKRIDVLFDGQIFTSYQWPENVYKPILYPVFNASGKEITRGFPLAPREGERNDHIHQAGIWLNYGKVNGLDFWGNGYRGYKEPEGGEIRHLKIESMGLANNEAILRTAESWLNPGGRELLAEKTEYHFLAAGSLRIIDRITTLTAKDTVVVFSDTKEGMFGIRVARELELPLNENVTLLDVTGKPASKKVPAANGATGNYRSSKGLEGESVWGTRAEWMDLYGYVGNEKISVVICDHPRNPGYPAYWHARGYGLFAVNPLGWKDFTKGAETYNFTIRKGESATFRYRVIISSGVHLSDKEINELKQEFFSKY